MVSRSPLQQPLPLAECVVSHLSSADIKELGFRDSCGAAEACFCPSRNDYFERMSEVGGYGLQTINPLTATTALPPLILARGTSARERASTEVLQLARAVKYWEIGGVQSCRPELLKENLQRNLASATRPLFLFAEDDDAKQDAFWAATTKRSSFFRQFSGIGSLVLFGPGFSVYSNGSMCRKQQLYNTARSVAFVSNLSKNGVRAIPCIFPAADHDVGRIGDWLASQGSSVTHLAMNGQMGAACSDHILRRAVSLERAAGRKYHWTFFGPSSRASFMKFMNEIEPDRLTFVTSKPVQRALAHRDMYENPLVGDLDSRFLVVYDQINELLEQARFESWQH